MKWILHDNKRMYFPEDWTDKKIRGYYNDLMKEQDINSPHRYETSEFQVQEGDVVADLGAAEGIFALSIVEKAKKIYLFECEEKWIKVLKKTFEPWQEKVIIINKYISNNTEGNDITLDKFLDGSEINFIKADIEGAESKLLMGAKQTLSSQNNLRIVLCTYHQKNDEQDLNKILTENNFYTEFSKGYVILLADRKLDPPYLRRGVIRAKK
jgi:hypothetical protein